MTAAAGSATSQVERHDGFEARWALPGHRETDLDGRYRAIGIHAVAAAVRFSQSEAKPSVSSSQIDQRFVEVGN